MVTATLQATVDALTAEDRSSLMDYLAMTTDVPDLGLTPEQLATLERRDTEMDTNPAVRMSLDEFKEWVKKELL